ncbi:MAG: DUF4062 domain-containing protein [Bryobacterales bacterium]|nr:DUF4062 domain-containing protein [Bryobacterales bacterium]
MFIGEERRYQVFVSSTFRDLTEERQKVLQAVLEANAFPAGMELFPSADDEQWEFIKGEIKSSDYYMVIVAGKYGSMAEDGVSYTEKEYDYAVGLGKPVLGFLFKDLGELKGSRLEEDAGRREKLRAFRDKVSANKLVKFYSNADELKSQALLALTTSFQRKPQTGWVRATQARRAEDLEELNQLKTQLIAAREEIAKLKATQEDARHLLAQGEERVTWRVKLNEVIDELRAGLGGPGFDPPVEYLEPNLSWEEVFKAVFAGRNASVTQVQVRKQLRMTVAQLTPTGGGERWDDWLRVVSKFNFEVGIDWDSLESMLRDIRIQFLGLGYITISQDEGHQGKTSYIPGVERWTLTPRGVAYAAKLFGKLRPPEPASGS